MEGAELVEQDTSKAKIEGIYLLQRNLSCIDGKYIRHNPEAIGASIIELICDDLKFKDMQNDTQYVMLNDKLKDTKKTMKAEAKEIAKNNNSKKKQKETQRKSKFFKKYQERIDSIKESDLKLKQKTLKEKI